MLVSFWTKWTDYLCIWVCERSHGWAAVCVCSLESRYQSRLSDWAVNRRWLWLSGTGLESWNVKTLGSGAAVKHKENNQKWGQCYSFNRFVRMMTENTVWTFKILFSIPRCKIAYSYWVHKLTLNLNFNTETTCYFFCFVSRKICSSLKMFHNQTWLWWKWLNWITLMCLPVWAASWQILTANETINNIMCSI